MQLYYMSLNKLRERALQSEIFENIFIYRCFYLGSHQNNTTNNKIFLLILIMFSLMLKTMYVI